jgi:hypothetical protein
MKRINTQGVFICLLLLIALKPLNALSQNKSKLTQTQADSIRLLLESMDVEDQRFRNQLNNIAEKYGGKSPQMKMAIDSMHYVDSLDLKVVAQIIDRYGWLSDKQIGTTANETLFMVIQHSNLQTQEKYLPIMTEAVANGSAKGKSLGLLIDRIELKEGRSQIYGTQVSWDMATGDCFLMPLIDPDNVDKRRAEIGMIPIAEYLLKLDLIWDLEAYKKDIHSLKKVNAH